MKYRFIVLSFLLLALVPQLALADAKEPDTKPWALSFRLGVQRFQHESPKRWGSSSALIARYFISPAFYAQAELHGAHFTLVNPTGSHYHGHEALQLDNSSSGASYKLFEWEVLPGLGLGYEFLRRSDSDLRRAFFVEGILGVLMSKVELNSLRQQYSSGVMNREYFAWKLSGGGRFAVSQSLLIECSTSLIRAGVRYNWAICGGLILELP